MARMSAATAISHTDEINARILAISEDRIAGFVREPMGEIARACELLHNPHCSLVDVSLDVGFSSQSHMTTVFRRFMKTTPAAYREDVLGLRRL